MASTDVASSAVDGSEDTEAEVQAKKKLDQTTRVISAVAFLQLTAMSFTWGARDAIALERSGSAAGAAKILANNDAFGALAEFILNPVFGKLSDTFGRKIFLGNAPLGIFLMSGLVAGQGTLTSLFLDKLINTPLTTCLFTVYRAALSDMLKKSKNAGEFAARNAQISAFAGLGIIIGPVLSGWVRTAVSKRGGKGDQVAFAMSSVMGAIAFAFIRLFFKETLAKEDQCELDSKGMLADFQPFSFMRVWKASPAIGKMFWSEGFQNIAEGRCLSPVQYLLITQDFKWTQAMFANALAGFGISLIFGGMAAKKQMQLLGMRLFTTISNLSNAIAMLLQGGGLVIEKATGLRTPQSWALSILFSALGSRKRDGVEGCLLLLGTEAGLGSGFVSAAMMNWRAVFNVLAPVALGNIYAWGKSGGRNLHYLPWLVAAASNLAAEGILQTLSNKQMLLDEKGNALPAKKKDEDSQESNAPKED